MNTLFVVSLRAVFFKGSIHNITAHVMLGIAISFIGPVAAAVVMKKSKYFELLLYSGKYVKMCECNGG